MKLSIIIPVRDGGPDFARCLRAVEAARAACQAAAATELIVADDGSTDDSPARAAAAGAMLVTTTPGGLGPAAARNLGARAATGDVLFFVDADVALHAGALRRAAEALQADPDLQACFGSYDDAPGAPNFLSQYKNLLHHYIHQNAQAQASTFWTGCGAIRRAAFEALGGFDAETYPRPSIEDIDLGYRLRRAGGRIRLLKDMQCVHLKRWTARSLLQADIFDRGIPWTVLLWRESRTRHTTDPLLARGDLLRFSAPPADKPLLLDLNLQTSNRLSVALTALLAMTIPALAAAPQLWPAPAALVAGLLALNRGLYAFFLRRRGAGFLLRAIPWHWLYYGYNSLSFALGTLQYFLRGARPITARGALAADPGRRSSDNAPAQDA